MALAFPRGVIDVTLHQVAVRANNNAGLAPISNVNIRGWQTISNSKYSAYEKKMKKTYEANRKSINRDGQSSPAVMACF